MRFFSEPSIQYKSSRMSATAASDNSGGGVLSNVIASFINQIINQTVSQTANIAVLTESRGDGGHTSRLEYPILAAVSKKHAR